MTVKLELKPELDAQLREAAEANRQSVAEFIARLVEESLPRRRRDNALALFESWQQEDATDDCDELAKRRDEWKSMKTALNLGRSSDRVLFP